MPTVIIATETLFKVPGPHLELLHAAGLEVVYPASNRVSHGISSEAETIEQLDGADAMMAGGEWMTAGVLDHLPRLRVIARTGVGYDRVDVASATDKNVVVTITPTANHSAVAEHALALLFAISKNVVVADRQTRSGEWPRDLIQPIRGKTLGILGFGRIGRSMATRSAALGMTVIAHDPFAGEADARARDVELVSFDDCIVRSDVLSIHCPANESTQGMINRSVFSRMKRSAILINTARGTIVNEPDLIDALRRRDIHAAGLDVFGVEPPTKDNSLFELDNVVMTPHAAGLDAMAMRDMGIEAAECIVKLYQGQWPGEAVVNGQLRDNWQW